MKYRIVAAGIVLFALTLPFSAAGVQSDERGNPQNQSRSYSQGNIQVPPELTLPAGTLITVRTTQFLSSDRNMAGDPFESVLEQPLVAQGWVTARRGQVTEGRVATAQKAGRVQGVSQLGIELSALTLVDGQQLPIRTELVQMSAGTSHGQDAAEIGTATGIGTVIGAAAEGGAGAAIGAAVGAAAGVTGVLATRGKATEIVPESVLTFRLTEPVTISTQQSQQAFLPVTEQDYPQPASRTYRAAAAPYPPPEVYPPVPYYPPPYYYPGYYPPPFGYYGYYGPSLGVVLTPRVYRSYPGFHFGGRFHR